MNFNSRDQAVSKLRKAINALICKEKIKDDRLYAIIYNPCQCLLILMQLERWVEIKSTFHLTHTKLLWYWIPSKLKRPRWWIKNWQHEDIHGPYNELLKEKKNFCNFLCCICMYMYNPTTLQNLYFLRICFMTIYVALKFQT